MPPRGHVDMICIVFMRIDGPVGIIGMTLIVMELMVRRKGNIKKTSNVGTRLIIWELLDCLMSCITNVIQIGTILMVLKFMDRRAGNVEQATCTTICIVTRTISSRRIKGWCLLPIPVTLIHGR